MECQHYFHDSVCVREPTNLIKSLMELAWEKLIEQKRQKAYCYKLLSHLLCASSPIKWKCLGRCLWKEELVVSKWGTVMCSTLWLTWVKPGKDEDQPAAHSHTHITHVRCWGTEKCCTEDVETLGRYWLSPTICFGSIISFGQWIQLISILLHHKT